SGSAAAKRRATCGIWPTAAENSHPASAGGRWPSGLQVTSIRCRQRQDRGLPHRLSWRQVKHRISESGGREWQWKAAGEELFYATARRTDERRRALGPDN